MPKRGTKIGSILPMSQNESRSESAEAKARKYAVGERVFCSEEDAATLRSTVNSLAELHQRLGALRDEFLAREHQMLRAIAQAREGYMNTAIAIGKKAGINLGPGSDEVWTFNPEESVFVRSA